MHQRITLIVLFSCLFIALHAQKNQTIFAELLGDGFAVASVNYDTRFGKRENGIGARTGFSIIDMESGGTYTFPIMLNFLAGSKKHFLEFGFGTLYITRRVELASLRFQQGFGLTASLMYRLQAADGFMFRAGLSSIHHSEDSLPVWPGISIGYSF